MLKDSVEPIKQIEAISLHVGENEVHTSEKENKHSEKMIKTITCDDPLESVLNSVRQDSRVIFRTGLNSLS